MKHILNSVKIKMFLILKRSFGCILFEMIKLRKLFIGKTIWETGDLIKKFNNNDLQLENIKPLFCKIIFKYSFFKNALYYFEYLLI